ncbi:MAG: phosphoribosylanthranilate isomerase [Chloroflexota bacterium]|nr:phosphoribosylanthranilate isomerase [Chloroflexota bacterium]
MTRVQVCGFQTTEPMLAAANAGADAVALVLIPGLKRSLSPDQAEELLADYRRQLGGRRGPEVVGLFGGQDAAEVNALVERLGLDAVQLCADEGMGYAAQMRAPIYKVIGIDPALPRAANLMRAMVLMQRHSMAGHRLVLDAKPQGAYGGTGQRLDWGVAADLAMAYETGLAGGLNPDKVAEAIAQVRPAGVDASSGIETDGEKDPDKVRAFVEAVRAADRERSPGGLRRLLGRRRA